MNSLNKIIFLIIFIGVTILTPTTSQANSIDITFYEGAWSPTVKYAVGNFVTYNNQTFLSILASNLNKNPQTSPTYWQLLGTNGNVVLNGSGAPAFSVGKVGDFYIDTTNKLLYGPKVTRNK